MVFIIKSLVKKVACKHCQGTSWREEDGSITCLNCGREIK